MLDQRAFEHVLSDLFDMAKEKETAEGLQACVDLLLIPFTVFVTTNYNRSLSSVAARLVVEAKFRRMADVIYPNGSPAMLWERSIHYLHSDIHHISDIVMTDSSFARAYGPTGPQRKTVETLANSYHILFIGTDFTDTDVHRVFLECKDIFHSESQTLRFALTAGYGQAVPTVNPLQKSRGIKPIYYSTPEPAQTSVFPEELPPRYASMWQMVSRLRQRTEAYVKRADLAAALAARGPLLNL